MRSIGRLSAVRAQAEALMCDTFDVFSPNGVTTDADGMEVPAFAAEGSAVGRMHGGSRLESVTSATETIGGVDRPVLYGGLRIPLTAPVPAVGWEYVLTTPGPLTDPALAGRRWHVVGLQADTYATARRLNVVEVPA